VKGFEVNDLDNYGNLRLAQWLKSLGAKFPSEIPEGDELLIRFIRSIYGLGRSGRDWNHCWTNWATFEEGFVCLKSDECIFRLYRKATPADFPDGYSPPGTAHDGAGAAHGETIDLDFDNLYIDIDLAHYVDDAIVSCGKRPQRRVLQAHISQKVER
jgi:hypothetical protein